MFEYKIINSIDTKAGMTKPKLDSFGAEGWELVAIIPARENIGLLFYFKRRCKNDAVKIVAVNN